MISLAEIRRKAFRIKRSSENTLIKDTINPFELFVEKRQFFNQNNQWLYNITYH